MNAAYKVLGISDEVTECCCCGRTNLKRTVTLGILDADGTVLDQTYFGTECAAKAMKCSAKEVTHTVKAMVDAQKKAGADRVRAENAAEYQRWESWLLANVPNGHKEVCRAIQYLGGFGKARAMYKAAVA